MSYNTVNHIPEPKAALGGGSYCDVSVCFEKGEREQVLESLAEDSQSLLAFKISGKGG